MTRCAYCDRPAVFQVKGGRAHADKDHDLCKRCWRDAKNRATSQDLKKCRR